MKRRSDQSSRVDRKTIERNRRNQMKALCFELASLVPSQHWKTSKEMISQQDQLDVAASYIKQLRERIEKLEGKKKQAMKSTNTNSNTMNEMNAGLRFPLVELKDMGSTIQVVLISGLQKNFMLYEVISILEEEGAEFVSASFSTVDDKVFHTVHAQAKISRLGIETSRVCQRLQDLVY